MDGTLFAFIQGFTIPAVIFLVLGIILMVVEMFTPGFGVAGIAGIICLAICVVLRAKTFAEGLWMTVVLLAIVGLMLLIFLRSATRGAISRSPLVLNDSIEKDASYISSEDLVFFIGKIGVAHTILRPAGTADVDGVKLDVVTDGEFIPAGTPIKITDVVGRRIIVSRIEPEHSRNGGEYSATSMKL